MATQYQPKKDSMDDNLDEKTYSSDQSDQSDQSNQSDRSELILKNASKSNNFMHQVEQRRKLSFSDYNNENDTINNTYIDNDEWKYENELPILHNDIIHAHSAMNTFNIVQRPHANRLLADFHSNTKLRRRHSADKILCKPSTKNVNSVDYLNRMIITLRSKIGSYTEDLRIAAELGQNLYTDKSRKDELLQQYENDMNKLRAENDELSNVKNQLLQTTQLDAEHTKRLEVDLHLQKSSHIESKNKYFEECEVLREQLGHSLSDVRHLQQLNDRQRIEIQTLDSRNEQISQNAGETIDDLSRELAEEKDGHSNLKHKYRKLHNQFTKIKINYEKRGTEINNLKRDVQEKEFKILSMSSNDNYNNNPNNPNGHVSKQVKLLYRQIDNFKDEIAGMQKHVDSTKSYLKTTMHYLENTGLLMRTPDIDKIYTLCKNARQFLGIHKPPPDPVYEESPEAPPELPRERSPEPLPTDDTISSPSIPREPTPELKVSQIQTVPISVPAAPKTPTPPPMQPPSIPQPTQMPSMPMQPPPPQPTTKITNQPSLPPSLPPNTPNAPNKPSLPLPPPQTPPKTQPKLHHTAHIPDNINIAPTLPPPHMPSNNIAIPVPSLPNEVMSMPKPKRFSSAIQPKMTNTNVKPILPIPIPQPRQTQVPSVPMEPPPPQPTSKITNKPSLPPSLPPNTPNTPHTLNTPSLPLPLPPPKTRSKLHHTAHMPDNINITPTMPPHMPSNNISIAVPSIPNEVMRMPKPKRFSSAMQPKITNTKQIIPIPMPVPPQPIQKQIPQIPAMPSIRKPKTRINAKAIMPQPQTVTVKSYMPPPMPSASAHNNNYNMPLPSVRGKIPKAKTHNLGVMPAQIVDEKPLSVPSIPNQPSFTYNAPPLLPKIQAIKKKVKVVNTAMAPPQVPHMPALPTQPSMDHMAPAPHINKVKKMESVSSQVQTHNSKQKKKKKKPKKPKKPQKQRDTMDEQKQHLTMFFSTYSDSKNWNEGGKENGVQKYILKFAEREPLHARMAFLYSMTLYLGQIVGVNKRCISHAFMLFKSVRAQIDTLCEEFALILQTLEHHNDDKLWKYVYSFLYNAAAYFKHIQRFVGTRTSVDNPRKYSRALKQGSRDFSSLNTHKESTQFRKLSGLSEISGVTDYQHQIYGNVANKKNNTQNTKRSSKKKKHSSYAQKI